MSKLKVINFLYSLKYNYETIRNCKEHGCSEGVCRCSTIHNAHVTALNFRDIVDHIYKVYFDNSPSSKRDITINTILSGVGKQIDLYTIDRILRAHKIWMNDSWDIEIVNRYYGEEISSITLNSELATKIEQDLDIAFGIIDLDGRVQYLLSIEYGYLLSELEGCRYELVDIDKSDIIFGNKDHYNRIEKSEYYSDDKYNDIRGIVIPEDSKYRLIDGYHRIFSADLNSVKVLKAIKI